MPRYNIKIREVEGFFSAFITIEAHRPVVIRYQNSPLEAMDAAKRWIKRNLSQI